MTLDRQLLPLRFPSLLLPGHYRKLAGVRAESSTCNIREEVSYLRLRSNIEMRNNPFDRTVDEIRVSRLEINVFLQMILEHLLGRILVRPQIIRRIESERFRAGIDSFKFVKHHSS